MGAAIDLAFCFTQDEVHVLVLQGFLAFFLSCRVYALAYDPWTGTSSNLDGLVVRADVGIVFKTSVGIRNFKSFAFYLVGNGFYMAWRSSAAST